MTSKEKKEIELAERRCTREVRAWKRNVSKKLNSLSPSEQVKYLNERAAKVCAEHGINFSY